MATTVDHSPLLAIEESVYATLQDEAYSALLRGWRVICLNAPVLGSCTCLKPDCPSVGKHPYTRWRGLRHPDPVLARQWFAGPRAVSVALGVPTPPNLGIVTGPESGIVVVDIDPRNFGDDTLFDLERRYGPLPPTPQVLTGGGGWHYYFVLPSGLTLPCGVLAEGIDFKAEGGYVVGPRSLHKSGGRYIWEVESHPDDIPLAELPEWIIEKMSKPKSTFRAKRGDGKPRPAEVQATFAALWRLVGITLYVGDGHYRCVFHDDHNPSLHIESERCLWHCFGCGVGGGLLDLTLRLSDSPLVRALSATTDLDNAGSHRFNTTPWPVPDAPAEKCHLPQVHRGRTNRSAHRAMAVLCGNWACGTCGPYHKGEWLQHLAVTLSGPRQLSVLVESKAGWQATHKALKRAGDDYVVFDVDGLGLLGGTGDLLVITSGEMGQQVERYEAQSLLRDVVAALPYDALRISTSRTWRLGGAESRAGTGDWTNLGQARRPIRELSVMVEEYGWHPEPIRPVTQAGGRVKGTVLGFRIPEEELDTPVERTRMAEIVV